MIHTQDKFLFPALNSSSNFATIDYEAHINTKIDYSIHHIFTTMSVVELNTLQTICEVERTQLLTLLQCLLKIHNLLVFSQPKIVVTSYMLKALLLDFMIAPITSLLYI